VAATCAVLATGCEPDSLSAAGPQARGFVLDAGQAPTPGRDAGTVAPPTDGGVDPGDAGGGTPRDAGQPAPDAGAEPTCACPALPPTCVAPPADTPMFSSDRGPMQEGLIDLISCAETSIQAALYTVEWRCLTDALFDRLARVPNLQVQLVVDDDQCPRATDGRLACALRDLEADARVTVVDDARSAYMHHKFLVVDGARVWTGSANMAEGSFCSEQNDALVLSEPAIVAAYQARFTELFEAHAFGPQARTAPARGGRYTVHFSPQSPLSAAPSWHEALLASIAGAQRSIRFALFSFTRADLADALVAAHARGVDVKGVVSSRYGTTGATQTLQLAGIEVRKDLIHHKLLVVDTATVAIGSANWSNNAWSNQEDSLFIVDPALAAEYAGRIDAAFAQADPL
jgi:phosphatidylserine/phosphatidylglycerophosphate/cardiolipin synthase-like enzyme